MPHFVTCTVGGCIDVFSRESYKELFTESLKYGADRIGLVLPAWVIMTNHVHLIISSNTNKLEHIVRDIKKLTSKKIIAAIEENTQESSKARMLNIFSFTGKHNNNHKDFHADSNRQATGLSSNRIKQQQKDKATYSLSNENPVRSGLVWGPGTINTVVPLTSILMNMGY